MGTDIVGGHVKALNSPWIIDNICCTHIYDLTVSGQMMTILPIVQVMLRYDTAIILGVQARGFL